MDLPRELQGALLDRRVVYLRGRLDGAAANAAVTSLLLLGRTDPTRAVEVYLDTPGGSPAAALAVLDVLRTLGPTVSTTGIGTVGGAGAVVLAGGSAGRRFLLPHARVHLVEDAADVPDGWARGGASQAAEAIRLRDRWRAALAHATGRRVEEVASDLRAGRWLGAAEAVAYGLADAVLPPRR